MSDAAEKQRLVIVGASGRSAAQRAAFLGMEVVAIDQFGDRDLKSFAQFHSLHSVLDHDESTWQTWCWQSWCQAPLLLCGGMENRADVIDWFDRSPLACGWKPEMLEALRSPNAWQRWADAAGLWWPENRFLGSDTQLAMDSENPEPSGDWLVKSRTGAGGLGVRKWHGEILQRSEYLQRVIAGEVLGVTFVNLGGQSHLAGCMKSWTEESFWGPLPFIYRGSVGPIPLAIEEQGSLLKFANRVRDETGLPGVWQADFVKNQDGWWLLEINPRWSSSMELLEVSYGISLVAQHVAAVLGLGRSTISPIDWNEHSLRCREPAGSIIGKVVRYARGDLNPDRAMLERWWDTRWDGTASNLLNGNRLADIPGETTVIPAGYPVCTEYAAGSSIDQVQDRLLRSVISQYLQI